MRYRELTIRNVGSYAIGLVVALAMGLSGSGYWALLAFPLAINASQMIMSWFMVKWRPSLPSRGANVRSMLALGSNFAASNVVRFVNRNADNVLIGWYWGAGPLGIYARAYNLLMLPITQMNYPLASVAFAAFSRIQDNPEQQARYYLRAVNVIMWITGAAMGLLFVAAEPVIAIVLGSQWRECAPVFQLLAISALFQPLLETKSWLLLSRGLTDRLLKLEIRTAPFILVSFVIALSFGIEAVALSYSLMIVILLPWTFKFIFEGTLLTLRRLGSALLCPLAVCLTAVVASFLLLHVFSPVGDLLQLAVAAAGFAITYSLSFLILPVRKEVLSLARLMQEALPSNSRS